MSLLQLQIREYVCEYVNCVDFGFTYWRHSCTIAYAFSMLLALLFYIDSRSNFNVQNSVCRTLSAHCAVCTHHRFHVALFNTSQHLHQTHHSRNFSKSTHSLPRRVTLGVCARIPHTSDNKSLWVSVKECEDACMPAQCNAPLKIEWELQKSLKKWGKHTAHTFEFSTLQSFVCFLFVCFLQFYCILWLISSLSLVWFQ